MQYQSSCAPKLARKCEIEHWLPCGADGRSGGRSVYGHVITKFSRMGSLPHFLTHGAPRERSAINIFTQDVADASVNTCCKRKLVFLEKRL